MKHNTSAHSHFICILSHFFLVSVVCTLFLLPPVYAASTTQQKKVLTKRIQQKKKSLDQLQKDIFVQEKRIKELQKEEESVFSKLETVNSKIQLSASQLRWHNERLKKNRKEKKSVQKKLRALQGDISNNRALLTENMKNLYKGGRFSYLKILFSADSFTDFLLRAKYSKSLAEMEALLINQMTEQAKELNSAKVLLKKKEMDIRSIVQKISDNKKVAETEKRNKKKLLRNITLKRENFIKLTQEAKEASKKLFGLIDQLEKKRKKILVKKRVRKTGAFKKQKKKLPWPLLGKLVSRFGRSTDKRFKVHSFNNGIEIKAKKGTPVSSVHRGIIIFSDWFRGYGKLVIVDNGDGYYTLYGHLSEILLFNKKQIEEGDILGKAGDTGSIHGQTLYFEIRQDGKPVNPIKWLRTRK